MGRAAGTSSYYRLALIDGFGRALQEPLFEFVSVSTISGLLKDPNPLIGWTFNVVTEGAKALADAGYDLRQFELDQVRGLFKDLGHSPWRKKDTAAVRGTEVHGYFEAKLRDPEYLKSVSVTEPLNAPSDEIKTPAEIRASIEPDKHGYLDAIDVWIEQEAPRPIAVERPVVSLEHRFAGTLDLLASRTTEVGMTSRRLTDLKTSKGIYDSQFVQNGGYQIALIEEGLAVDERSILRVAPDGTFEERVDEKPTDDRIATFLTLLRLYDLTHSR